MEAHTLGEVDILGVVLFRVYSGTSLPIFIEFGSYLTDRAKDKLAQFFPETRCNTAIKAEEVFCEVVTYSIMSIAILNNILFSNMGLSQL